MDLEFKTRIIYKVKYICRSFNGSARKVIKQKIKKNMALHRTLHASFNIDLLRYVISGLTWRV